jgi:pimeloyl-ACP methyl ester carboxylesterase
VSSTLILLPGLDGTGELFEGLLRVIGKEWQVRLISYPVDRKMGYEELAGFVDEEITGEGDVVLVAESFSGPVAIRYAVEHPTRVRGLVLCASFVTSPVPSWLRWVVWSGLFRIRVPDYALRRWMVGRDAPPELVEAVRAAVRMVEPRVMAHRVREMLRLDCREALRRCAAPILYLRGDEDALVGDRCVRVVCSTRADVGLREIQGPHLLLQREPGRGWDEIEKFLSAIEGSGTQQGDEAPNGASSERKRLGG